MDIAGIISVMDHHLPPELVAYAVKRLAEPFDENVIKWKPQSTKYDRDTSKKMGQAAAYADPRAYTSRLTELFGIGGWFQYSTTTFSDPMNVVVKEWVKTEGSSRREEVKSTVEKVKLICEVTVGIFGVGVHSEIGEEWGNDENAATSCFAQAFKRACSNFGLGLYLYSLPKQWIEMTRFGQFVSTPVLPEWARPVRICAECHEKVEDTEFKDTTYPAWRIAQRSREVADRVLCFGCLQKFTRAKRAAAGNRVDDERKAAA
jgi:hypothetical protein